MKPFSPLYFIKENKLRCILLMFMIFLSYGVYLGGLYASNPMDNWEIPISYRRKLIRVFAMNDDDDSKRYNAFLQELKNNDKVIILERGLYGGISWNSVMGFTMGTESYSFKTPDDFRTYCEHMGIKCDLDSVKPGSIIMSELFANNLGYKLGSKIDNDTCEYIYERYTLDVLTKEKAYILYLIDPAPYESNGIMILGNNISDEELHNIVYDAKSRNNVRLDDGLKETIERQLGVLNTIYTFIVIFLSLILAVTINAAFVGMYQRRNFEFAVYRAIGISRRKITGKIVGELILIDLITLAAGDLIFFLILYLLNNLVFFPQGLYLKYYHPIALFGLVLCNITVIVPLIITRCRQLLKADICEY